MNDLQKYARRCIKVFPIKFFMELVETMDHDTIAIDLREIPVVFNRDGHYLDRVNKVSWWEYKGRAYTCEHLFTQTQWEFEHHVDRPLERWEIKQLRVLSRHLDLGPKVKQMLQDSDHWWEIHDMWVYGAKTKKRLREFMSEHNLEQIAELQSQPDAELAS